MNSTLCEPSQSCEESHYSPKESSEEFKIIQQQIASLTTAIQLLANSVNQSQNNVPVIAVKETVISKQPEPIATVEQPKSVEPTSQVNPYELVKKALKDPELISSLQFSNAKFNRTDDGSIPVLMRSLYGGGGPLEPYENDDDVFEALIDTIAPSDQPKGINRYFWKPKNFYAKSQWDYDSWRQAVSNGCASELKSISCPAPIAGRSCWTLLEDGQGPTGNEISEPIGLSKSFEEVLAGALAISQARKGNSCRQKS